MKKSAMSAKALLIFATMAVVFVSMAEATPNKFRKLLWSFLKKWTFSNGTLGANVAGGVLLDATSIRARQLPPDYSYPNRPTLT